MEDLILAEAYFSNLGVAVERGGHVVCKPTKYKWS